jgi:hypothetical protein
MRRFPFRLATVGLETHQFSRQSAFDKDHLAGRAILILQMADAAGLHVEGFDFY